MASDNGSDWAVQLPSYGITPAQADIYQNENARKDAAAKAAVKPVKMGVIPEITPTYTNNAEIDNYLHKGVNDLQLQLIKAQQAGATDADLKNIATNGMQQYGQLATVAKDKYADLQKNVQELAKLYPSADVAKLQKLATEKMNKDYLRYDDKGQVIGANNPSSIPLSKNYLEGMDNEDNLPSWNNWSGALNTQLKAVGTTPVGESDYKGNKGQIISHSYSGTISPFSEVQRDADGKVVGVGVKKKDEIIGYDENNKPKIVTTLPEDAVRYFPNSPAAKADFAQLYAQEAAKLPQPLNDHEKEIFKRKVMYDYLNNAKGALDGYSYIEHQKAVIPRDPRININLGLGGQKIQDLVEPIKNLAEMSGSTNHVLKNQLPEVTLSDGVTYYNGSQFFDNLKAGTTKTQYQRYVKKDPETKEIIDTKDLPIKDIPPEGYIREGSPAGIPIGLKGVYFPKDRNGVRLTFNSLQDAKEVLGIDKNAHYKVGSDGSYDVFIPDQAGLKQFINSTRTGSKLNNKEVSYLQGVADNAFSANRQQQQQAQPKAVPQAATPTKTYKINGKDYNEDAVEKAAKASGMSISEYLIALKSR